MISGRFRLTSEVFHLAAGPEAEGGAILYAPELGFACKANADLVHLLARLEEIPDDALTTGQVEVLQRLEAEGLLNGRVPRESSEAPPGEFAPTQVTLFPSNQCHLRCTYCYAAAGERAPRVMPFEVAAGALEIVLANVKARGLRQLVLGFHGGGEPLHPWPLVRRIVEHAEGRARAEGLECRVHSATNGVLSTATLEWVVEHFCDLNISFDGLPEIQDRHRPLASGAGSFRRLDRTLRFLDERGFTYGLRSTISRETVDRMEECLEFIATHYRVRTVHFEPLNACGRCATTGIEAPDLDRFAERFLACTQRAAALGIRLTYSGGNLGERRNAFCGVARDNFAVTPEGFVTTCYEVTSADDPRAATFFIGRVSGDGRLQIDRDRREFLRSLTVDRLDYCRDCFAKWHCAGDCLTKLGHTDYGGARGHDRCRLNRRLLQQQLVEAVRGGAPSSSLSSTPQETRRRSHVRTSQ